MPASWSKHALSVNLSLAECPDLELISSERYYFGYVLDTDPYPKDFVRIIWDAIAAPCLRMSS